jgi:hypothetical protein
LKIEPVELTAAFASDHALDGPGRVPLHGERTARENQVPYAFGVMVVEATDE